jgi:hypothetical protein
MNRWKLLGITSTLFKNSGMYKIIYSTETTFSLHYIYYQTRYNKMNFFIMYNVMKFFSFG